MPNAAMEPRSIRLSRTQACVLLALGFPPVLSPSCTQYQVDCIDIYFIYLVMWMGSIMTYYDYLTQPVSCQGCMSWIGFRKTCIVKVLSGTDWCCGCHLWVMLVMDLKQMGMSKNEDRNILLYNIIFSFFHPPCSSLKIWLFLAG